MSKNPILVMKFGGFSLTSPQGFFQILHLIKKYSTFKIIIILSAIGSTTDLLIQAINKAKQGLIDISIIKQQHTEIQKQLHITSSLLPPYFKKIEESLNIIKKKKKIPSALRDSILSYGEKLSVSLLDSFFKNQNIFSHPFFADTLGITIFSHRYKKLLEKKSFSSIKTNIHNLPNSHIPIITGFFAQTKKNKLSILGRESSDYSAVICAAALNTKKIILWKNVNGIYSHDPNKTKEAKLKKIISYNEALSLMSKKHPIIHRKSIKLASKHHISLYVKNFFSPEKRGSIVSSFCKEKTSFFKFLPFIN